MRCEDLTLAVPRAPAAETPARAKLPPFLEDVARAAGLRPGWIGITFTPVGVSRRQRLRLPPGAVTVTEVLPRSPAAAAGLRRGDIITGAPGRPFAHNRLVRPAIAATPPGSPVALEVLRAGKPIPTTVFAREAPNRRRKERLARIRHRIRTSFMAPTSPHRGPGGRDESRPTSAARCRGAVLRACLLSPGGRDGPRHGHLPSVGAPFMAALPHPVGAMDHATVTSTCRGAIHGARVASPGGSHSLARRRSRRRGRRRRRRRSHPRGGTRGPWRRGSESRGRRGC